jgi:hypothetical protein
MDTAAVMKNLDLFITSDTAVAHLAGALGVPVWLATSVAAGWQWMTVREDSPWYPSMRLFRQPELMVWEPVFERMAVELTSLVPLSARMATLVLPIQPGELLDRIARLEAEATPPVEPSRLVAIRAELDQLSAARDRVFVGLTGLSSLAGELRSLQLGLRRAEDGLRACEREGDFGPKFVELARSISRAKDRREGLLRQLDSLLAPDAVTGPRTSPRPPEPPRPIETAPIETANDEPIVLPDGPRTCPSPISAEAGFSETPSPDRRARRRRRASVSAVAQASDGAAISESAKSPENSRPD